MKSNGKDGTTEGTSLSICTYFSNEVSPPISLDNLARQIDHKAWFSSKTTSKIDHLKGELPVEWNLGETVLKVQVANEVSKVEDVLYLRFSGKIEVAEFIEIMHGKSGSSKATSIQLLESKCS